MLVPLPPLPQPTLKAPAGLVFKFAPTNTPASTVFEIAMGSTIGQMQVNKVSQTNVYENILSRIAMSGETIARQAKVLLSTQNSSGTLDIGELQNEEENLIWWQQKLSSQVASQIESSKNSPNNSVIPFLTLPELAFTKGAKTSKVPVMPAVTSASTPVQLGANSMSPPNILRNSVQSQPVDSLSWSPKKAIQAIQPAESNTSFHGHVNVNKSEPSSPENYNEGILEWVSSESSFSHRPHKRAYKKKPQSFAGKRCQSCNTNTTPEWRKGPTGPKSLCNACGLQFAKSRRSYQNSPSSPSPSEGAASLMLMAQASTKSTSNSLTNSPTMTSN